MVPSLLLNKTAPFGWHYFVFGERPLFALARLFCHLPRFFLTLISAWVVLMSTVVPVAVVLTSNVAPAGVTMSTLGAPPVRVIVMPVAVTDNEDPTLKLI